MIKPAHANTSTTKARNGFYIVMILAAASAGFVYGARTTGLFACQPPAVVENEYVGTCNVTQYGDYDHGALWFGLEEKAQNAAAAATVLFVGDSRMQFGLSSKHLEEWFVAEGLTFYLLGFSHGENYLFFSPLLSRLQPSAKFYVFNIDGFFEAELTGPADSIMNDPQSLNRYKQKYYWQKIHGIVCGAMPTLCGNESSYVRKRSNGMWTFQGAKFLARTDFSDRPLTTDWSVDYEVADLYENRARNFLAEIAAEPGCIVLTDIPNFATSIGTADALAKRLDLPLVAPQIDGLTTFDGSHLTPESADRWAKAFMDGLIPYLQQCLRETDS